MIDMMLYFFTNFDFHFAVYVQISNLQREARAQALYWWKGREEGESKNWNDFHVRNMIDMILYFFSNFDFHFAVYVQISNLQREARAQALYWWKGRE